MPKRKTNIATAELRRDTRAEYLRDYPTDINRREYPITNESSVVICAPKKLEEVQNLIDVLKEKQPLIMDLTNLNGQIACRILDFMSGAVYAMSGKMQNYKGNFYLVTPSGCGIKNIYGE